MTGGADGSTGEPLVLPAAVRDRVLALAADRLGALAPDLVPPLLRAVARFTPAKRARLGAVQLAAALEADAVFRQAVAERVRETQPELAEALVGGGPPPGAPPQDVAAAAYLLRPEGWRVHVEAASAVLRAREQRQTGAADAAVVRRLTEQLEALRGEGRAEAVRLRDEAEAAHAEVVAVRRRLRELGDRAGRAEAGRREAERALSDERAGLEREREQQREDLRRLAARLAEAETALSTSRAATRDGRQADELRLRVLLDAVLGAAAGLRRELALAPLEGRPADALAGTYAAPAPDGPATQGRRPDDPALLDALLGAPLVHLLVDGYNVTKLGYGEVSLQAQRTRLLAGLGGLAARTGAEVTVVFDGADHVAVSAAVPRGVRLLFSRTGETADEVLRRLAAHEPPGRPVVVVSSDREVADGVRASGARPVPSAALLRLLSRT